MIGRHTLQGAYALAAAEIKAALANANWCQKQVLGTSYVKAGERTRIVDTQLGNSASEINLQVNPRFQCS
jgi:hypothetical protein